MVISPRWRKVWRDLWLNKTRTLLVVFSIFQIPPLALALQGTVALIIPLLAGIFPVLGGIVVTILAFVASFLPAWSAARLTVREVLAYE
jgi:ABC-type lipoprotein release transport system permease subunit